MRMAAGPRPSACFLVAVLVTGMLIGTLCQAKVYRWVDGTGRVHFGDRPPDGQAQALDLPASAPPGSAGPPPADGPQRMERRQRLLDLYRDERERKAKAKADRAARTKAREQRCAAARNRLERYRISGYLYEPLADGERRILTREERRAATERARSEVDRWCK